ncbi:MAG: hypothetical protein NVS9B10_13700 [Nevskia sp.]
MNIDIAIDRSLVLPVDYQKAEPLLSDLEGTIGRFPNLKKLTRLDEHSYFWEMKTMGSRLAKIAHDVSYGARYTRDLKQGTLSWEPIPGKGNASVRGHFRIARRGSGTELSFRVEGRLADVPVPLLYRPLAPKFISAKFDDLVERFLARTGAALTATAGSGSGS